MWSSKLKKTYIVFQSQSFDNHRSHNAKQNRKKAYNYEMNIKDEYTTHPSNSTTTKNACNYWKQAHKIINS